MIKLSILNVVYVSLNLIRQITLHHIISQELQQEIKHQAGLIKVLK